MLNGQYGENRREMTMEEREIYGKVQQIFRDKGSKNNIFI